MKINMKDWMQQVLQQKERIAVPIMTHSGIEMIGRKVLDAVTDGQVHCEAVKALSNVYPSAASTVIMDLTVEAEAFGAEIRFSEHEVPSVLGRLVTDGASIEQLQVPSLDKGRIKEYLLANQRIAESSTKPVLAGCIGPYSLAGRLFDMSEIMMALFIEPDNMRRLLDKCTSFIIAYCKALKESGANGVVVAEPAAGLLSNELCLEFSSAYVRQIVEAVQDDHFLVILHNCGNTGHCTEAMVSTGAAGYHFGNQIDMVKALADCPPSALVMGNLNPVALFKMASASDMYAATALLLEATRSYPNFVLSSGCDTPPEIPVENIQMFYQALADYNKKIN